MARLVVGFVGDIDRRPQSAHDCARGEAHLQADLAVVQQAGVVGQGREDLGRGQIRAGFQAIAAHQLQGRGVVAQLQRHLVRLAAQLDGLHIAVADGGQLHAAVEGENLPRARPHPPGHDQGRLASGVVAHGRRAVRHAGRGEEQFGIAVGLDDSEAARGRGAHAPCARGQRRDGDCVEFDIGVVQQPGGDHGRAGQIDPGQPAPWGDQADLLHGLAGPGGELDAPRAHRVGDHGAIPLDLGENLAEDLEQISGGLGLPHQFLVEAGAQELPGAPGVGVAQRHGEGEYVVRPQGLDRGFHPGALLAGAAGLAGLAVGEEQNVLAASRLLHRGQEGGGLVQGQIHAGVAPEVVVCGRNQGGDQAAAVVRIAHLLQCAQAAHALHLAVEAQDGNAIRGVGQLHQQSGRAVAQLLWVAGRVGAGEGAGRVEGQSLFRPGEAGGHTAGVVQQHHHIDGQIWAGRGGLGGLGVGGVWDEEG